MAEACAVILWTAVMLYALLAGADFGAGFWDLVAGGDARGARPRAVIDRAVGPVWEANHVWLIFVLVVLWTAFPPAYSAILSTLFVPLTLAALGIVLRGSSFAFRKMSTRLGVRRAYGAIFALSAVLTPFFLGAALGGIASGRVPPGNAAGDIWTSWANPSGAIVGALAVAGCAYLAAIYLTADARRLGDASLGWAPASWPAAWPWRGCSCCARTRPTSTTAWCTRPCRW
jgi:cytochrome d ubiquinol oxidase subunit II